MSEALPLLLIAALGLGTYALRIGGHLVLSRFARIPPRVEVALEAVPAAVLTAIVAPIALAEGPAETLAAAATVIAALRLPINAVLLIAVTAVVAFRAIGL